MEEKKEIKKDNRVKYHINGKPVTQILDNKWADYLRFLRLLKEYPLERAVELAKTKRKPGAPNTLIYKNKKLTELSKEYKFKYHTLRAALLRGGIDEYIDIDEE